MKLIKVLFLPVFVGLIIASCTKDKIVTKKVLVNTASDSLGLILAGAKGSTKSWKVTTVSYTSNGGLPQNITLASCVLDNIYKFTNNSTQDFIQNEGSIKCNSADSTITEQGNWAITDDGKNLVVQGLWFDDLSNETEYQFLFTATGAETGIVTLSDTALVVKYSFPYNNNGTTVTIAVTVTFTKTS